MEIFRLTMNPASDGDALLLTWGDDSKPHHALVDLGRNKNYKALKPLLKEIAELELCVFTHIDADHIEGAVALFKEQALPLKANHVWFNAFAQLEAANERLPPSSHVVLGAAQAEKVTGGILKNTWPWNAHFASGIVSVDNPEALQPISIDGNLKLTLLSPSDSKLAELIPSWNKELEKAGLRTTDPDEVEAALAIGRVRLGGIDVESLAAAKFKEDDTRPNGASIAFIAEYGGKRILMGADAHPSMIEKSIRSLGANETNRYKLDCFKLSHHGSKANISPELLQIIDCTRFAISTDGSRHGHPDAEAIARILKADPKRKKTLIFNFRQDSANQWEVCELMTKWNYECVFPLEGTEGIEIDI